MFAALALHVAGDPVFLEPARMAGQPYAAGGIRVSVAATRGASDDDLRRLTAQRRDEARRAGITTVEIKSGYGLDVQHEARCLQVGGEFTTETTFLGAHVVPPEFDGRADDYVHHVCTEMLDAAAPHSRWIDCCCEVGAFDVDQSRAVLQAGRAAEARDQLAAAVALFDQHEGSGHPEAAQLEELLTRCPARLEMTGFVPLWKKPKKKQVCVLSSTVCRRDRTRWLAMLPLDPFGPIVYLQMQPQTFPKVD